MEDTKLEESLDFVDAIDFANGLRPYEEGLKDMFHAIGNRFKKTFGSNAGTAQRAFDDAKQNLQNAQLNQQAAALNAQANQINGQLNQKANPQEAAQVTPADEVAQQIIDLLNNAFKKDLKTQAKNDKDAEKQKQQQAIKAQKDANAIKDNGTGGADAKK